MAVTENPPDVPVVPTLGEIKAAIPEELFRSNLLLSLLYVLRSAILASTLALGMWWVHHTGVPLVEASLGQKAGWATLAVAFTLYWFLQGVEFWGIFTLGHDCGHGSFSKYPLVNSTIGVALHSFISVPYDPWRMSHRHHHKNTGNLDTDEIFYPMRANQDCWRTRLMCYTLGGAWFCYLLVGFPPRMVSHVSWREPMWGKEKGTVKVSLASLAAWYLIMTTLMVKFGVVAWVLYYFIPVYVFGCFLVVTTFLHHNADDTVWYAGEKWNYVRGNLNSIDRDYGWLLNSLIHNIGTHQVHHLFPIIPHYNLKPATVAFRKAFPGLVRDRTHLAILPELKHSLATYLKLGASCSPTADVFSYASLKAQHKKKKGAKAA